MNCCGCIFAEHKSHQTVNSCRLNRIQTFIDENIKLEKIEYNGKEYYSSNDRLGCTTYRDIRWENAGQQLEDQIISLKKELKLDYDLVFLLKTPDVESNPRTEEILNKFLSELKKYDTPQKIILIFHKNHKINRSKIMPILADSGYKWSLVETLEEDTPDIILNQLKTRLESKHFQLVDFYEEKYEHLKIHKLFQDIIHQWESIILSFDTYTTYNFFTNTNLWTTLHGFEEMIMWANDGEQVAVTDFVEKAIRLSYEQDRKSYIKSYEVLMEDL